MRFYSLLSVSGVAIVALSGCASIVAGSTDPIKVVTAPPTQAQCTLSNERGSWSGSTSDDVIVKRSRTDLDVNCVDASSGAQGKQTLVSGVEPWVFGNILIGGLIGLGIDWGTGATYDYPESVNVEMSNALAQVPSQLPAPAESYVDKQSNVPAPQMQEQAPSYPTGVIAAPPIFIPATQ